MSSNPNNPRPQLQTPHFIKANYTQKTRIQLSFPENSRWTKQSFRDECDINRIMSRYQDTGQLPNVNELPPQYLDATAFDYQEHMQFIAGAQSMFEELPSALRNRFQNDPGEFLDFCSNEKNRPELAEMGLLRPETAQSISTHQPTKTNSTERVPEGDAAFELQKSS
nr:MAG: internal scaffolding protein [Microvirus sp.]